MCHLKIDIHGDGVVTAVTSGDLPFEVAGQFFATTLMMEMFNRDNAGTAEFPGDFRNGYIDFGWDKQSDEWKKKKRTIECTNSISRIRIDEEDPADAGGFIQRFVGKEEETGVGG